jgi:predicted glycosyltransferase
MHKRILYCVLDWGLGHATRSIPIIRALLNQECEVVLASDSLALDFLKNEFPALQTYSLPSYDVKYKSTSLFINGIQNLKSIRNAIRAEHAMMDRIVADEKIDAIISDNRYGCYLQGIPSVMITHQLQFKTGNVLQDKGGKMMIQQLIKPFDRIWIPDDAQRTLSGELSMSDDPRVKCIGTQSTLSGMNNNGKNSSENSSKEEYDITAILSGPEPQRSELENEVRAQMASLKLNCAIVRGVKGDKCERKESNITTYNVLNREEINHMINVSSVILCRSGYSSLMDLHTLGKKAILVPTPGQPEQKYLAERMRSLPKYVVQKQGSINIISAHEILKNVSTSHSTTHATVHSTTQSATRSTEYSTRLLDDAVQELFELS